MQVYEQSPFKKILYKIEKSSAFELFIDNETFIQFKIGIQSILSMIRSEKKITSAGAKIFNTWP